MTKLILPLKAEYFDAIRDGSKLEEYRLANDYWTRRLHFQGTLMLFPRTFASIILTKGYPRADDMARRIELHWRGFHRKVITHPHFGSCPVEVFAIDVSGRKALEDAP